MKSLIKFFVCGMLVLALCFSARSQNALFSTTRFLPDTSFFQSWDSTFTTIKYLGTTPYSGHLNIYYTTGLSSFTVVSLLDSVPQVNFQNQNDTIQIQSSISFDTTNWQGGNNIVVVWSSGNAIAPFDSLQDPVYLKTIAGIGENNNVVSFSIYPTLTSNYLFVESESGISPKKILIEDISGRIIAVAETKTDSKNRIKINVSELQSGIYFLDIILPDKQRLVSKFVKTD